MVYTWDDYWIGKALQHKDKLLARLSVEQRLKGLSEEELEAYLNKLHKRKSKSRK